MSDTRQANAPAPVPRGSKLDVQVRSSPRSALIVLLGAQGERFDTVTDIRGKGSIANVPAGLYTLQAFRNGRPMYSTKVAVGDKTNVRLSVAGEAPEGSTMPQPLEFQVGLFNGHAVAHCPQTGHTVYEPLRDTALALHRRGHVEVGADMLDQLDHLSVGDDGVLDAIGDDAVIEVGAGKVRKALKKGVSKVVKVAKKVASSKLGKAIKMGVAVANPAGAAIMAVHKGAKIVKKAASKKKPATPAAKKQQTKAKNTTKIASALNKGKVSPKKADKLAKKKGIPKKDVADTAAAMQTAEAAQAGDPQAAAVMDAHESVEQAQVVPMPVADADSPSPDDYGAEPAEQSSPADYDDQATDTVDVEPEGESAEIEETEDEGWGDEGGEEEE
jgi:hypothetical protein